MMVLRSFAGAMLALAVAVSPALACKGETEIHSDNFTDQSGPWEGTDNATIGGGFATLKTEPGKNSVLMYTGQLVQEFDVCVDLTFPATRSPEGGAVAGVLFWFNGNPPEFYGLIMTPGGIMGALRLKDGKPLVVSPFRKQNAIKVGTDAKNTIRITAKGNTVTVYINDTRVASFRGLPVEGYLGFYAEGEKDQANNWRYSNFKLTDAPK
jgi:hypothetical protein